MKEFIDREEELKTIMGKLESNKKELIIIYGMRKIGKTKLALKSLENKDYIHFLATEKGERSKIQKRSSGEEKFFVLNWKKW